MLVKCESCGREVPEENLDRYMECGYCRAEERDSNMTVGDLNNK